MLPSFHCAPQLVSTCCATSAVLTRLLLDNEEANVLRRAVQTLHRLVMFREAAAHTVHGHKTMSASQLPYHTVHR